MENKFKEKYSFEKRKNESSKVYQKYPDSIKVPDMLLRLSKSLSKIDKTEQSCITLKELISKYPESRLIKKAEMELQILNCQ